MMNRCSPTHRSKLADEKGAVMLTMIFFLFCLGSLVSLLLFQEQADYLKMKVQHTADLISKGARAAGKWEYVDTEGERRTRLFATTDEAVGSEAEIIRGAREEAEILWGNNRSSLEKGFDRARITHQKGEQPYLYRQGIYHVRIGVDSNVPYLWDDVDIRMERVSQSGVYD